MTPDPFLPLVELGENDMTSRSQPCGAPESAATEAEISSATPTELLPEVPRDPWEATSSQSFAAELRIGRAIHAGKRPRLRDARQLLHDHMLAMMNSEVVGWIREASRRVVGGNCAFVDDDLSVLAHLAQRAVEAGLTDKLAPDVKRNAERGWAARQSGAAVAPAEASPHGNSGRTPE